MKKICKLKINDGDDRERIVSILARAGYTVAIKEEDRADGHWRAIDFFVIIHKE